MRETAHLLRQDKTPLGILTRPDGVAERDVVVVMLNSGLLHRIGPFRLYVQLARRLAEIGIPSLRIDWSGKGDSTRREAATSWEALGEDFEDARRFLKAELGAKEIVLLGLCSGADDATYLISTTEHVRGAILLDGYAGRTSRFYINHYRPRLLKVRSWAAFFGRFMKGAYSRVSSRQPGKDEEMPDMGAIREFGDPVRIRALFQKAVDEGTQVLSVFTAGVQEYYNYDGQLTDSLKLASGGERLTEIYFPKAQHTYPLSKHRSKLIETVCDWFDTHWPQSR